MPKLTEKEILARLDEADAKTLAEIERLHREGNCARTIHVETCAPLRVINAVIACINPGSRADRRPDAVSA